MEILAGIVTPDISFEKMTHEEENKVGEEGRRKSIREWITNNNLFIELQAKDIEFP